MAFKSSPVGNEITAVFYNVPEKILSNYQKLKSLLLEALERDNFKILKTDDFVFQPQGYTVFVLLAESHAAIHTYPEYKSLVFNLYSCREKGDGKKTLTFLKEKIKAEKISYSEREVFVKNPK